MEEYNPNRLQSCELCAAIDYRDLVLLTVPQHLQHFNPLNRKSLWANLFAEPNNAQTLL